MIPKISFTVKQTLSGGVALGPAQVDVGLSGKNLSADFILPDGSPWRQAMEGKIEVLLDEAQAHIDHMARRAQATAQQHPFLHGLSTLCGAVDSLLRDQIPAIKDWIGKRRPARMVPASPRPWSPTRPSSA